MGSRVIVRFNRFSKRYLEYGAPGTSRRYLLKNCRCLQISNKFMPTSFLTPNGHRFFNVGKGLNGIFSFGNVDYTVYVKTGDVIHAGTDANVKIILHGADGNKSTEILLDNVFKDDFERGNIDVFKLKNLSHLNDIQRIEFWRDTSGFGSNWFVDYIEIENMKTRERFMFPVFRWIKPHVHYVIREMDNCLPQEDPEIDSRKQDLEQKREVYQVAQKVSGGPGQVK
ncbi:hypothetical protein ACJMK2_032132 [Sinanodonta woodiana]|uniref:PLAT domain-containing protein n=1 Tax=Sinanodonta woodiana TaxID=1069815 RepID=A0ABD3X4T7_SINWO